MAAAALRVASAAVMVMVGPMAAEAAAIAAQVAMKGCSAVGVKAASTATEVVGQSSQVG